MSLEAGTTDTTATYTGPIEGVARLLGGRLGQDHTPGDADVSGDVGLDELRPVFPGY